MKRLDYINYDDIASIINYLTAIDPQPIYIQETIMFRVYDSRFEYHVVDSWGTNLERFEELTSSYLKYQDTISKDINVYSKEDYELFYNWLIETALHIYKNIISLQIKYDL